jgi:hypothetical protein
MCPSVQILGCRSTSLRRRKRVSAVLSSLLLHQGYVLHLHSSFLLAAGQVHMNGHIVSGRRVATNSYTLNFVSIEWIHAPLGFSNAMALLQFFGNSYIDIHYSTRILTRT